MAANFTCIPVTTDPGITGIGVRMSIYLQSVLGLVMAAVATLAKLKGVDSAKSKDMLRSSWLTGFGLLLAALIQYKSAVGLSIFDQLVVLNLAATQSITSCVASFLSIETSLGQLVGFLFATFTAAFGFLVWSSNLHPPPGGCGTIFVLFGHNIAPSSRGLQGFCLFMISGSVSGAIGCLLMLLLSKKRKGRWLKALAALAAWASQVMKATRTMEVVQVMAMAQAEDSGKMAPGPGPDPVSALSGLILQIPLMKTIFELYGLFVALVAWIYLVVSTEQMVSRNGLTAQTRVWSFGQTLPLILLLSQLLDFASIIHKLGARKPEEGSQPAKNTASEFLTEINV